MADFDMLVHHALPGRFGQQEPLPCFQEGIDEDVLALAGDDGEALALLVLMRVMVHIDGPLRHGEVRVGDR